MEQLFLSTPAIVTALGNGIKEHIQRLIAGGNSPIEKSKAIFNEHQIEGKVQFFGAINQPLREFDENLDPQHHSRNNQLLWHALQQIEPQIEQVISRFGKQRIAVVIGTSTTGVDENIPVFRQAVKNNDWAKTPFNSHQQYFSAPADFVAHQYGLQGLCYGISTACTSGARALISAARLLNSGLCDAVICGGVDTLSPLTISGFNSLSVLAPNRTNPFSENREGINIGEGAAIFVMTKEKLEEHAIALLGYGSSSDAYHMSSPHPEGKGAICAFEEALKSAQLNAEDIGWVNLHGTGTIHNDQMESIAIAKVFGNHTPCTTTKPYTGHTLGAAGAVEAAISWGMINRSYNPEGSLPTQLWDQQTDPQLPNIAITHNAQWQKARRIAASSSFAFGGNNSVLILGEQND
ncbi:beta-ketoacyl-ACP synthase [Pasteurella atlantica]|uniref:beta-ketoacyl-ACP synthase n=1 Tax=Pasteurellaceae TaxID=712 RepID=UPI0027611C4D|nr:beta-ketoacyl-ACP synthase [Pasteurella atlantica]MDP8098905.1 beta-ketoacyl-ACP synthase [Pasteurella atlantica]MDP8106932.1 beta-ketoacyl-ACP synthase [Pasteurella atlantica]MDP8116622.1 beta-ketoacyl-ACP synthase [Pasteurella atlantica]